MSETAQSRMPEPSPARLEVATTAVLVLDLTTPAQAPDAGRQKFISAVGVFLERARRSAVAIVFTCSHFQMDTPVDPLLKRRTSEPVLHPDGFDKFTGGELHGLLQQQGAKNLVVTGAGTNMAVMYTATAAARHYPYNVFLPLDGVYSGDPYHHEYALHQLSVLPARVVTPIRFTTLETIEFY